MKQPTADQQPDNINWGNIQGKIRHMGSLLPYAAHLWGVPRNGLIVALLLAAYCPRRDFQVLATKEPPLPDECKDLYIIDDIYDTGATLQPYLKGGYNCAVLFKRCIELPRLTVASSYPKSDWLVFPWEDEKWDRQLKI